jgi:hypothetical protein
VNNFDPLGLATLEEVLRDGVVTGDELAHLELSDEQMLAIIEILGAGEEAYDTPEQGRGKDVVYGDKTVPWTDVPSWEASLTGKETESERDQIYARHLNLKQCKLILVGYFNKAGRAYVGSLNLLARGSELYLQQVPLTVGVARLPYSARPRIFARPVVSNGVKGLRQGQPARVSEILGLELAENMRMPKSVFIRMLKDVADKGFTDKIVDYVVIDGTAYVLKGCNRDVVARILGKTDELILNEVKLPYLGWTTAEQVIRSAAERKLGVQ